MDPLYVSTPLWEAPALARASGSRVLLKMEAFQPTGSFKSRGMSVACEASRDRGATGVVCASGGNAGLAVAFAARRLQLPAVIVVPETSSPRSAQLIAEEGAEVIVHGRSWDDAHALGVTVADERKATYVHPFDDPDVWQGHSTIVDELACDGVEPGALVVAVGGGGLLCGLLLGLHRHGWTNVPVVAVETEGADSFAQSVAAGELVTLDRIGSLATTLGARRVTPEALAWVRRHPVVPHVVPDRAAVAACARFADDHRVLVEPACGAALAAVYDGAPPLAGRDPIVVIVCGGAGVSVAMLSRWMGQVGL